MAQDNVPQAVLAERLGEAIRGRKVRAVVFTTFTIDPEFFELHVLPVLFDQPFSQIDKVRRIQLEDALRSVEDIAVYYDRTALSQSSGPAQLDWARIGVRVPTGVFHPKLVLALVENAPDLLEEPEDQDDSFQRGPESLIVGALSANLTRAGWWENLEAGHFEEIDDKSIDESVCPFRKDLLGLIRHLSQLGGPKEEQRALDRIRRFLTTRTSTAMRLNHSARGRHYTRLFYGQSELASWLSELRLRDETWNLEVISPYFDGADAGTLDRLVEALAPKETRIYLPENIERVAQVTQSLYARIEEVAWWSSLPTGLTRPGRRAKSNDVPSRFVHAKVYRLWNKQGKQVMLVGSVNLTAPAHSRVRSGNSEAGFLIDVSDEGIPRRWWLQRVDDTPAQFLDKQRQEDESAEPVYVDLVVRFDWSSGKLDYRVDGQSAKGTLEVADPAGEPLFVIDQFRHGHWVECESNVSDRVRQLLRSNSFLKVTHPRGTWRVLVREEGMHCRPSLLTELTPEEILLYWSLLTPAQRESFIEEKLGQSAQLEGMVKRSERYQTRDTVFDRFAGVYHAFERLHRHVLECVQRNEIRDAEARLFGEKYDSLPQLLSKTLEQSDDSIMRYIVFLCARQICDRLQNDAPEFMAERTDSIQRLNHWLNRIPDLADALPLDEDDRQDFLAWYEPMFLGMIEQGGGRT